MVDYLRMVLIYLKQELPDQYTQYLELDGWVIKFVLPEHEDLDQFYAQIKGVTESYVLAIRERKADLNFAVWKAGQSKDFIVYK